jgi:Leucine-rich repeat (LRR) protein
MSSLFKLNFFIFSFFVLSVCEVNAQVSTDSSIIKKEYSNLEEALKAPEKVYRLNLNNQKFKMPSDSIWSKFINLEYLSLKNDHLKKIPGGLGRLKKLRVLDLSGNDFKILPQSLSSLENLTELFLNDEKEMDFNKSIGVIDNLPNLRILHLENDNLKNIPKDVLHLRQLEKLYMNNNKFKEIPKEIYGLKNLKYLDLHDNKYIFKNQFLPNQGFGVKINF